jgi:hypothetical protein
MTPEFIIAIKISIASLVVSILSLFISWRALTRDRSDLRVSAEFHLESEHGTTFKVRLVNQGRRPIHIENILLRLNSGKSLLSELVSPKIILDEGESYVFLFPLVHYQDEINSPLDIKRAEVYDTKGKKYTFPFSKLKKQIVKEWTEDKDWLSLAKN